MNLDEQLTELLGRLGVVLEQPGERPTRHLHGDLGWPAEETRRAPSNEPTAQGDARGAREMEDAPDGMDSDDAFDEAECSLFQTSREHYGVFYRLDLIAAAPQLRIFTPEEHGVLKMRCYLVRPLPGTPAREWFALGRAHDGSPAYDDARDLTEQHLLFAAGEVLKRLFWSGEPDTMQFPPEIEVCRLA